MLMLNLNPDLSGSQLTAILNIGDSVGVKADEPAMTHGGNFSLVSLVKRVVLLLSAAAPSQAETRHVQVSNLSIQLASARPNTREVVIYNTGKTPIAICLGKSTASFGERAYSLRAGDLVVEVFSGEITAISEDEELVDVIVTIKY